MNIRNITFIGNSHITQFMHIKPSYGLNVDRLQFPGASIKGLIKENSTIGLNNMIKNYDFIDKLAIFILGQCDIEFGYYYKSVMKNEKLDIYDDYLHIYNDTLEVRNMIHKKFNTKLKEMCKEKDYNFVDIWDDITTDDIINKEFKPNTTDHHLKESEHLFDFLYKKIINL